MIANDAKVRRPADAFIDRLLYFIMSPTRNANGVLEVSFMAACLVPLSPHAPWCPARRRQRE